MVCVRICIFIFDKMKKKREIVVRLIAANNWANDKISMKFVALFHLFHLFFLNNTFYLQMHRHTTTGGHTQKRPRAFIGGRERENVCVCVLNMLCFVVHAEFLMDNKQVK